MPTSQTAIINRILATAAEYRASDLHFTIGNPPIVRVDGRLVPLTDEPVMTPEFIDAMGELFLTTAQQQELEQEREVLATFTSETRMRFRVHAFYQRDSKAVSLRLIANTVPTLESLGLPRAVEGLTKLDRGLVIVCGPFGSGRSATIAALLNTINQTQAKHIHTIEKPVEYVFVNTKSIIEQREIGRDALTFEQAFAASLKEDVDVMMVSELDTPAIIANVLEAVAASRLVFGSMNTPSVVTAIEQIINRFPDDQQATIRAKVAEALEGVIAQRLLPRVGGGRILVAEVMLVTPTIRSIIRDGHLYQLHNTLQTSREEGMMSLDRALANLVRTGEILIDDALAEAADRENLRLMIRNL